MAKNRITTIDIGTNSVKALELEFDQSDITVVNSGAEGYLRQSAAEKITDDLIVDALIRLVQSKGLRTKPVAISVPRHIVTVKGLSGLPTGAKDEDIRKMVPLQVGPELPFAIADSVYSYYNLQRSPEGISLEVVAAKKSSIERYVEIADRLGLKLKAIIPSSFATYAVIFDQFKEQLTGQNLAVADIGAGMTDFCIIRHGRLAFSRSFAVGGNDLTQDFEEEYNLSFQEAEERKLAEASLQNTLAHRWAENLATQIDRSLRAFSGESGTNGINALWLCGGSSLLAGLGDYLSERLGIQVSLWNPLQIRESESISESMQMGLSVALGLGLIGIDGEKRVATVNANLLPKEVRERAARTRRKIRLTAATVLAAIVLTIASMGLISWQRAKAAEYQQLKTRLEEVQNREQTKRAIAALEKSILIQQTTTPYVTPLEVLREMSASFPNRQDIALTNFNIGKNKVTMNVEAKTNVDAYKMLLTLREARLQGKVKLFTDVDTGPISKGQKEESSKFQVTCMLNKDALQETE